jgi:hypothetical protein
VDGEPTQTRLLDNFEQLGVDKPKPRFAWVVNDSSRAQAQTAYQIIVAADEAYIVANQGKLWDSGKVASAQQYGVEYAGAALTKTTKYWWKVRTWNKEDHASPWSAASTFVTKLRRPYLANGVNPTSTRLEPAVNQRPADVGPQLVATIVATRSRWGREEFVDRGRVSRDE